jgi:hypothetical protein
MAVATAEDDKARADQAVTSAGQAEGEARDRFHDAEAKGFPRDTD